MFAPPACRVQDFLVRSPTSSGGRGIAGSDVESLRRNRGRRAQAEESYCRGGAAPGRSVAPAAPGCDQWKRSDWISLRRLGARCPRIDLVSGSIGKGNGQRKTPSRPHERRPEARLRRRLCRAWADSSRFRIVTGGHRFEGDCFYIQSAHHAEWRRRNGDQCHALRVVDALSRLTSCAFLSSRSAMNLRLGVPEAARDAAGRRHNVVSEGLGRGLQGGGLPRHQVPRLPARSSGT
jgi:hypothetical protein